ncbi:MAG TPA: gluconate:H+ symporter, partial [Flavilitoribacter sp.]|nr:gluconate:H+ symporter [Flavilitoribacter sp.]
MPIVIIIAGIAALLVLIMALRVNAFISLLIVSIGVGLAEGMDVSTVVGTVQKGIGNTLNFLAPILGLGAMLGGLIAESGAAQSITNRLTHWFGEKRIQWAMLITGFIVGIPLFYSVGFLMLIPIIFAVHTSTRQPLLYVGIPMIAALSVTHGFLPPHPAPSSIAVIYGADISMTLLYGLILAVPTVIIAGPLFGRTLRKINVEPRKDLFKTVETDPDKLPSFGIAVLTCLIPVLLMGTAAIAKLTIPEGTAAAKFLAFIGDPIISLLIAVLIATYTLGVSRGKTLTQVMEGLGDSVKAIAMIMLIIAGGGAFKQILTDSGAGD